MLAAVHHAEVIATASVSRSGHSCSLCAVTDHRGGSHRDVDGLGRPRDATPLARDTVFAAVMITCNGILGLSLLVGRPSGWRRGRILQRRRCCDCARHGGDIGDAHARPADLHDVEARPRVLGSPAHVCRSRVALPLSRSSSSCRHSVIATRSPKQNRRPWAATRYRRIGKRCRASGSSSSPWSPSSASRRWSQRRSPTQSTPSAHLRRRSASRLRCSCSCQKALAAVRNAQRGRVQTSVNLSFGSAMASID